MTISLVYDNDSMTVKTRVDDEKRNYTQLLAKVWEFFFLFSLFSVVFFFFSFCAFFPFCLLSCIRIFRWYLAMFTSEEAKKKQEIAQV